LKIADNCGYFKPGCYLQEFRRGKYVSRQFERERMIVADGHFIF
jgi:hypothetical protein